MSKGKLFSQLDLMLIEDLVLDPSLTPRYNALSGYLVWDDELPSDISSHAMDVLQSLWYARSLFHRGLTIADHPINPEYSRSVWEQALKEIPQWPGFKRMTLDGEVREFFEKKRSQEDPF